MKFFALSSMVSLAAAVSQCPETVNTVTDLNVTAYMGTWYEQKSNFFFKNIF